MAYNSYFPVGYQPYYQQPVIPQYQPQNAPNEAIPAMPQANIQPPQNRPQNGIIWVQGEAGAKAYPVAPNTTVQLWDAENQIVYLKSADVSGMPTMKILDYTIRDDKTAGTAIQKQIDLSGYVTRSEFEKALAELKGANADE